MRKKLVAMLILAMTGTMFLGGCGSDGGSGSGGGDGKSGGKVKIRFASWDEAEDVDAQQAAVDKFNDAHDDIEVTLEAYGGEFDTKISAGMGSNDMPIPRDWSLWIPTLRKRAKITRRTSMTPSGTIIPMTAAPTVSQSDLPHTRCSITRIFLQRQALTSPPMTGPGRTYRQLPKPSQKNAKARRDFPSR